VWPFKKRAPESPEEIAAEQRLEQVTREVAWAEFDKESLREAPLAPVEPLGMMGLAHGKLDGDPDPGDERGLREALRDGDDEREQKS
jgi:hypothetical protein